MNLLFIHQNFPGQYLHLAPALASRGNKCIAIGSQTSRKISNIELIKYKWGNTQNPRKEGIHNWLSDFNLKIIRAELVAEILLKLKKNGFKPDLIIGHPGWGELLAVKDIFPKTPVLQQLEFVYQLNGADYNFDPEFRESNWSEDVRLRIRRAPQLLSLTDLDYAISPTKWQAQTAPKVFSEKIKIIHEGIDTDTISPNEKMFIKLKRSGQVFQYGDEVISYVARNLEPYRGFHSFMRMLPYLQSKRPNCHAIIVGGDDVSYGKPPSSEATWRELLLDELRGELDLSRIHFVGRVSRDSLTNLFQVSACHVYLTYPFVLSWSLLEAMSCQSPIVASNTAPVKEFLENNKNSYLVDFFNYKQISDAICESLTNKKLSKSQGVLARKKIKDSCDLKKICLPSQFKLIEEITGNNIK